MKRVHQVSRSFFQKFPHDWLKIVEGRQEYVRVRRADDAIHQNGVTRSGFDLMNADPIRARALPCQCEASRRLEIST
jgi:hypothetical protein